MLGVPVIIVLAGVFLLRLPVSQFRLRYDEDWKIVLLIGVSAFITGLILFPAQRLKWYVAVLIGPCLATLILFVIAFVAIKIVGV